MQRKTELKLMFYFTIIYLFIFTMLAMKNKNYEFLYYTVIMSALILLIVIYHKRFHLSTGVMAGLTLLGAMHIFGGNIYPWGTRLYDIWLIPGVFRYDNLVHFIGIFVATLVAYSLVHPHLDKRLGANKLLLSLILVMIALGMGSFNELFELGAVVFLGAAEQVGDYMNNAVDILFNFFGSIAACIYIVYHYEGKQR